MLLQELSKAGCFYTNYKQTLPGGCSGTPGLTGIHSCTPTSGSWDGELGDQSQPVLHIKTRSQNQKQTKSKPAKNQSNTEGGTHIALTRSGPVSHTPPTQSP